MSFKGEINIIAPNVNTGGALVLLMYLIDTFRTSVSVNTTLFTYLTFNCGLKNNSKTVGLINNIKVLFKKMDNALFFGNLPPLVKSSNSILYIHNLYIMEGYNAIYNSFDLNTKRKIKYFLLITYIKIMIKNVDFVMCQTYSGKKLLEKTFNKKNILVCPVYDDSYITIVRKKVYDMCYIGLPSSHKNHKRLFQALDNLGKKGFRLKLIVTIPEYDKPLLKIINNINENIEIDNAGVISHEKIFEIYEKSRMLIFPSLKESFGLPLIEATHCNLAVIASDLSYVYDVIEPTDIFDPLSISSIEDCIRRNINKPDLQQAKLLVENKILMLINMLS